MNLKVIYFIFQYNRIKLESKASQLFEPSQIAWVDDAGSLTWYRLKERGLDAFNDFEFLIFWPDLGVVASHVLQQVGELVLVD